MRTVPADLAAAIAAPERTARIRLSCDWDGDGHGGTGTLDDLSGRAATVKVSSVLQGTQPEQANVVEGTAAATLTVDLAKGDTADERLQAIRYFSAADAGTPLAGKPRLGRDLQLDVEFLTASGWRGVPLLRGTSRGLPVRVSNRTAQLQGLDYRAKLRTPVALPVVAADVPEYGFLFPTKPGLEATWVASYVLYQCGYPMSPPPRPQCRFFNPMHGSAIPFLAEPFTGSTTARLTDFGDPTVVGPITFDPGPFILATARQPSLRMTDARGRPADGAPMFDAQGRSAGRIEAWTQGDGSEWQSSNLTINTFGSVLCQAQLLTTGVLQLQLTNDAVTRTVNGPAYPRDGQWHQIGVHWDDAAGVAVFCVDGALTTVTFTPTPATSGGTDDGWLISQQFVEPWAEIQITTGIPSSTPFQPVTYGQPAVLDRLQNRLDGIVPGDAVEGWTILQELAAAEQGAVWLDPDGRPHVASRARLVSTAAQVPQRVVDATADMFDLAYDLHLDKVANVVTAPYQAVTVNVQAEAWKLSETVQIDPHGTVTILATVNLATSQRFLTGSANTAQDGTGTVYPFGFGFFPGPITASVEYLSDTAAVITVVNGLGVTVYLVDGGGNPNLVITGDVISQGNGPNPPVVADQASRDLYGDQPLTLPATRWLQRREMAWGMAMATAGDLTTPQPVFTDLPIPGDPRLEFFDRVTARDPDNTGLTIDLWYVGGEHNITADGHYTQRLVARPARDRFRAGVGLVGVDLVG